MEHSVGFGAVLLLLRILFGFYFAPLYCILLVMLTKMNIHVFFLVNSAEMKSTQIDIYDNYNYYTFVSFLTIQFLLFAFLCIPFSSLLSMVMDLWFDCFSKDEHPRLRRKLITLDNMLPSKHRFVFEIAFVVLLMGIVATFVPALGKVLPSMNPMITTGTTNIFQAILALLLIYIIMSRNHQHPPNTDPVKQGRSFYLMPAIKAIILVGSIIVAYQATSKKKGLLYMSSQYVVIGILTCALLSLFWVLLNAIEFTWNIIKSLRRGAFKNIVAVGVSVFVTILSVYSFGFVFSSIFVAIQILLVQLGVFREEQDNKNQPAEATRRRLKATDYLNWAVVIIFYLFFIITLMVLFGVYFQESTLNKRGCEANLATEEEILEMLQDVDNTTDVENEITGLPGYPICSMKWHGLDIVDFGLMADLAYWKGMSSDGAECLGKKFDADFKKLFPEWRKQYESPPDQSVAFYDLRSDAGNLSVITIRGTTSRMLDVLEDIDMYSDIGLFQTISLVVPIMPILPDGLIADLVQASSLPLQLLFPPSSHRAPYYEPVLKYVENITDRDVIITGHSLGGAIAQIVGSRTKHLTFTFSAPGIVYTRRKVGLSLVDVNQYTINVVPTKDPVPKVDKHGGIVQSILCTQRNPVNCHRLRNTVCELKKECHNNKYLDFCVKKKAK